MNLICDLDGTVWLAGRAIPGAADAIAAARFAGHRVLFATNNSAAPPARIAERLTAIGIPTTPTEVISSAQAVARLVSPGERVYVIGGEGLRQALTDRGAELVASRSAEGPGADPDPDADAAVLADAVVADAVVVGRDTAFDFSMLVTATASIRHGARFLASNTDPTFATDHGLEPGGGAIVAAVATATGASPIVAGKPERPMVDLIGEALGGDFSNTVVIGDVAATDGLLAARMGVPFGLVLSGGTASSVSASTLGGLAVEYVAADLAALIAAHFS